MAGDDNYREPGLVIVDRRPGPSTGDEVLRTADGRTWTNYHGGAVPTGDEVRSDYGDRLR